MERPSSDSAGPLSAADLGGLPPRAMVALAVRAALRALPAADDLPPETLHDIAAAWGAAALFSLGGVDAQLGPAAEAAMDAPAIRAAEAVFAVCSAARSAKTPERVAEDAATAVNAAVARMAEDIAAAAMQASRADLEWLRAWSGEKRAADGLVGGDFYHRPLWLRGDDEMPPEAWWRVLEPWRRAMHAAALGPLVEQHDRLLKGGGLDVEGLQAWLGDWYRGAQERSGAAERPEQAAESAPPDSASPEPPEGDEAPGDDTTPVLPGGIAVTAADTPALRDHLGRTPLVHTLADMLSSPEQALPMTIALLGDWGSGKTSVIEQLKRRLDRLAAEDRDQFGASGRHKRCRYLFATFNAWEYEQTDNLRAGLAQEVVNGLTADLGRWDKLVLAVTKAAKGNVWEFWSTVGGLALALLGIITGYQLATPDHASEALKTADLLGGGGLAAFGAYLLINAWRTGRRLLEHPLATQMATYLKLPSYGKHLGEVPVIKREIRELCRERLDHITNGRLLVVVDDLDRCHPSAVTETLDAIRLVMNLDRVAVIIAVDDRIAFRAVADHYKELEEEGKRSRWEIARDYLGKIIQLPVNLYDPWPSEVGEFVRQHLFQVSETAQAAAEPPPADAGEPEQGPQGPAAPKLTPAAEKLVRLEGVDAAVIPASGKDGAITQSDVRRYLKAQRASARAQAEPAEVENPALMERQEETLFAERGAGGEAATATVTAAERAEARAVVMEDTAEERELFAELTRDMGFNNPRQLIRLRNSYRLLKGYRHSRGSTMSWRLLSALMHGLFWYECLYQKRLAERQHAELVAWLWAGQPAWHKQAAQRSRNPAPVAMAQRLHGLLAADQWGSEYGRLMRTVDLVVLPNAQMGLILDRPAADAALAAQSSGTPLLPDPWGKGYVAP